jgi:uncharacterized membrane protein
MSKIAICAMTCGFPFVASGKRLRVAFPGQARGMTDYTRSTQVDAPPEALFAYLADVGNLPGYFARMTGAERGQGDEVEVTAKLESGREVEGKAWFKVDEQARTISWGSEGPNDYHGRLAVTGQGGSSEVEVHVSTERVESDEIDHGLADTLASIKQKVEEQGRAG